MAQRTPIKWIAAGAGLTVVIVALLVAVVALLAGRGGTPTTTTTSTIASVSSSTSAPTAVPRGDGSIAERTETFQSGALPRTYKVIEPADIGPGERLPWVLVLHGIGETAEQISTVADWRAAVGRDRFIAVFGQGVVNSWNLGPCCPPATLMSVDDFTYLDTVVATMEARPDVDTERQFMAGFSNGALMTYEYACRNPSSFGAIAPMAGSNLTGCRPSEPISLLHQHADNDFIVPYRGGVGAGSLLTGQAFPPVRDTVAAWAAADGCGADPVTEPVSEGVERLRWTGCSDGTRVELVTIAGVEHNWPRRGSYDPLTTMLDFFGIS